MKQTVSEYAKGLNVSVQTVYKKIKRGVITTVKEGGITYVIADNTEVKQEVKHNNDEYCNQLLKLIKTQQKEIKRLTKELSKAKDSKSEVLEKFIFEIKQLQAPKEDTIEIKPKKSKKKKK